jgi:integrase/recombinase XerD
MRQDNHPALWLSDEGERLTYWGLRSMVKRRAKLAGIETPTLHAFRRAFALEMLRAGVDVFAIQELMGHADLQVLRRYLRQVDDDLRAAHQVGSPVERMRGRR